MPAKKTLPGSSPDNCWYVYIIQAVSGRLYTGITTDISRRWQQHSSGKTGAKFFRGDKPKQLKLVEEASDRSSASKREAAIKQLSRQEKLELIKSQPLDSPFQLLNSQFLNSQSLNS